MKKSEYKLVKNISSYHPEHKTDQVLGDDWKIAVAWISGIKDGKPFKYSEEEVRELALGILREIIARGKATIHWDQEDAVAKELIRSHLQKTTDGGISVPAPYGEMISHSNITALAEMNPNNQKKFLILLSGGMAWGFIRLAGWDKLTPEQFQARAGDHGINEIDRKKWAGSQPQWEAGPFYLHRFKDFIPLEKPQKLKATSLAMSAIHDKELAMGQMEPTALTPELIAILSDIQLIDAMARLNMIYDAKIAEGHPKDESLVNIAAFLLEESRRRGLDIRIESPLGREAVRWSQALALEQKIYLSDILPHFKDFCIKQPYVYLVGSTVVDGQGNDIDLIIREKSRNIPLEFRICKQLPPEFRDRVHFIYDSDGPFTDHIPLFSLHVKLEPLEVIAMQSDTKTLSVPTIGGEYLQERGPKELPANPAWDDQVKEWAGKSIATIQAMGGADLPIGFYALENHVRPGEEGKGPASVHGDFRHKSNSTYGEGMTIAWQVADAWPDVRDIAALEKLSDDFDDSKLYKWGPNHPGTQHAFAVEKKRQPLEWLPFGLLAEVKAGEVGATAEGPGLFREVSHGLLRRGKQTPYYREYFLYDLEKYQGGRRVIFRLLATGDYQRAGEEEFHWESWHSEPGFVPSLLTRRERLKKDSLPVSDESGIPPEWEMAINQEFAWWGKGLGEKERFALMDQSYNQLISDGYLVARPMDEKEM
jgi:hypothetical protein